MIVILFKKFVALFIKLLLNLDIFEFFSSPFCELRSAIFCFINREVDLFLFKIYKFLFVLLHFRNRIRQLLGFLFS